MSIARVTYVKRSRKPYRCGKCGDELPKGSAYRWYVKGFRSNYANIRCMKPSCTPKNSDLESSNLVDAYSAQETAEDQLSALGDAEENATSLTDILADFSQALRDTADIYREADETFGGGGMTENGERANKLEEAADEVEQWSPETDERPSCDDHDSFEEDCDECKESAESWWEEAVNSARDKVLEADFVY